jgi:hypothetical protein
MKYSPYAGLILSLVTVSCAESDSLKIHYDYAGLTQITIADDRLTYVTHTLKPDLVVHAQNLSSYDRHEAVARLTDEEKRLLVSWVQTQDWKRIAKEYVSGDPGSYGAAFEYVLDIHLGNKRHSASWDGTSDCPEIVKAVEELETICSQITDKG